jgi:hypothetical protein
MPVLLPGTLAALLSTTSLMPAARRRAPAVQLCDGWMFVDVRGEGPEGAGCELDAIVDPLGNKLLVGEERWHRVASPEGLLSLDVASRNDSLLCHVPSTSCAGAIATVVVVAEVDPPSAKLVGVGRCAVSGVAGRQPRLRVRVKAMPDAPLDAASLERAREVATTVETQWEIALALFQRVQGLELKAKLRNLGSSGSAAMLSIPMEQQIELSRGASSSQDSASARRQGPLLADEGIEQALRTGVSLSEAARDALRMQPDDSLALAPRARQVNEEVSANAAGRGSYGEPLATADLSAAQLSLFSFVALRLTRRSAQDPDDFLEVQPDPRAPTVRQSDGVDILSRLALCETRLQDVANGLAAKASLLAMTEPEDQPEDH